MPGDHSSLSVSTGTGIFLCVAGKMKLFAAAQKNQAVFSVGKRFHLNLYRNCEEKNEKSRKYVCIF